MDISQTFLPQLFQFILGITSLIIVHETGHFLVGRWLKVEVEEFGIGFPPRMVKLFKAGNTQYTLNWLPFGGFVRFKGENDPKVSGGLAAANPWVRLAVLFAGPAMNLLVGIILSAILFYNLGEPLLNQVLVKQVSLNSPADQAGLRVGDLIRMVDNQEVNSVEELHSAIYANLGQLTQITYQRGDQVSVITLTPRDPPPEEGAIGIQMGYATKPISWTAAIPRGINAAYEYVRAVLSLPLRIFQGETRPEEGRLVGYKGMFDIYQEIQSPLWFFMVITISLGIGNLLPIPALDGGRIILILPEILIRRRIPPRYENVIHLVGFAMLLMLLLYINLQDFINPILLPK